MSTTYTITTIERRTRNGAAASLVFGTDPTPARSLWYARVKQSPAGRVLDLSRFDDEDRWVIDGVTAANGMPVFYNGMGSRCTLLQYADSALAAQLDARTAAGDVPAESDPFAGFPADGGAR